MDDDLGKNPIDGIGAEPAITGRKSSIFLKERKKILRKKSFFKKINTVSAQIKGHS